jgi:hypothetical protein
VLSESAVDGAQQRAGGQAFWWRLADNLFRHLVWFALPVLALAAIGLVQARGTLELYRSTGTLSASTNPLVPEQTISGASAQFFESPAAATSRIINERLQTDSFLLAVAENAEIGGAVESGVIDLAVIRQSVWAAANGNSILSVNAQWADPRVSYNLVAAIIKQYQTFLTDTVASDATAAEDFYTSQLKELTGERDVAQIALDDFVAELPDLDPGENYGVTVQLQVERLNAKVSSIDAKIDAAEENIDNAQLARAQQTTEAGRSFTVIDQPLVPGAPESSLIEQVTLVAAFLLLGLVISAAALLVTTVLDQTVASAADLLTIASITMVATVPSVHLARPDGRPSGRRRPSTRAVKVKVS